MQDVLTWFDNPPKRGRKRKVRRGRRKLYGAAAAAHARAQKRKGAPKMARRGRRRKLYGAAAKAHARRMSRGGGRKRRTVRRASPRRSVKRRSYRRTSAHTASRAGRQLRYRRTNPPMFKGFLGQLTTGVQDAAFIVGGKAVTNIIAGFIPIGGGMALDLAKKAAAALAAGYVGRFISPSASRMMLAGGLAGVVEGFIKQMNIPLISSALSEYDTGYFAVGAYPQAAVPGVSAYPQQLMAGDDDDAFLYQ